MPVVSVVIPAYNVAGYLDRTLDSVSHQTLGDFECLVVDDRSTDATLEVVKRWTGRDRRIRLIPQRTNTGVSAARNAGLRMARAPLVAFLDGDDLLMRDSLMVRVRAWHAATAGAPAEAAARVAGSYCASQTIPETADQPPASRPASLAPVGFVTRGGRCPFNANQPLIRADVLREMGGFNEAMDQAEDYDLWARILRAGYWFAPAPHVAVTYRSRRGSAVRAAPRTHLDRSLRIYDGAERPLPETALTRSAGRMVRRFSDYQHQAGKADRILQFTGMALADPAQAPGTLAAELLAQLPDLGRLQEPRRDFADVIRGGLARQLPDGVEAVDAARLDGFVADLRARLAAPAPPPAGDAAGFGPYGEDALDRLWHPGRQADYDLLFLPHKAYHVWTVALAAPALRSAGIRFGVVDLSAQWREGGTRAKAAEEGLPLIQLGEVALGDFAPRLLVCFNDWDHVTRPLIVAAQAAGIATAAIVEGIQDYLDADTGRIRHPYRTADAVLLPGDFDRRYFPASGGPRLHVVGVPRVQVLRAEPPAAPTPGRPRALINANFSYNVLLAERDGWLRSAVQAVLAAGMEPVISRHPDDRGTLFPEYVTGLGFYDALETVAITVQRFASGVLEALARGVPVVYFNPHGEKVDKFTSDPMGAYPVAATEAELRRALADLDRWREAARSRGPAFLDHHAGPRDTDSGARIAEALIAEFGRKPDAAARAAFRLNLQAIDRATLSLTRGLPLFETPATAVEELRALVAAMLEADGAGFDPTSLPRAEAAPAGSRPGATPAQSATTVAAALPAASLGLLWRARVATHYRLLQLYRRSERWPSLHARLGRMRDFYTRNISPL